VVVLGDLVALTTRRGDTIRLKGLGNLQMEASGQDGAEPCNRRSDQGHGGKKIAFLPAQGSSASTPRRAARRNSYSAAAISGGAAM
jgi:hypothetical protein